MRNAHVGRCYGGGDSLRMELRSVTRNGAATANTITKRSVSNRSRQRSGGGAVLAGRRDPPGQHFANHSRRPRSSVRKRQIRSPRRVTSTSSEPMGYRLPASMRGASRGRHRPPSARSCRPASR